MNNAIINEYTIDDFKHQTINHPSIINLFPYNKVNINHLITDIVIPANNKKINGDRLDIKLIEESLLISQKENPKINIHANKLSLKSINFQNPFFFSDFRGFLFLFTLLAIPLTIEIIPKTITPIINKDEILRIGGI